MRILHVVECRDGGVLSLLDTYCRAQLQNGHEVHVLSPVDRVTGVHWHPWHIDRGRPRSLATASRELRETVRSTRPDVVHLHSFFAGAIGRLSLGGGAKRPAITYQPHSWAYDAVSGRAARFVVTTTEWILDRRTDRLLVNCADELREGRRHGVASEGSAVGVPIDLEAFSPADPRSRRVLGPDRDGYEHTILCVGRIVRQKGQDRLVATWRQDPVPGTQLVLVGGGDVEQVQALAGPEWGRSVRWVGHQADVRPWLRAADVLVVPSRYEGQSVAVAEALACGLPVVMCAVNGAGAAVVDGPAPRAGAVVGLGDMAELISECRRRVLDERLREREARSARVRATVLFEAGAVDARVEGVYREAVVSRGRGRVPRRRVPLRPTTRS